VDNSKNKTPALQGIHSLLTVCDPGLIFQKAKMIPPMKFLTADKICNTDGGFSIFRLSRHATPVA
jgi:hypothetical protein